MTAATPKTTERATPSTALDRRRAKWLATSHVATEAEGSLARLNSELEANARQREASKAALESAVQRAAELEKELKGLAKQRERLRADRTRAKRDVKSSRRRAKVTEQRFDKALMKDLLRKAKAADLAAN
jgi:chromosome segregation ATPase